MKDLKKKIRTACDQHFKNHVRFLEKTRTAMEETDVPEIGINMVIAVEMNRLEKMVDEYDPDET